MTNQIDRLQQTLSGSLRAHSTMYLIEGIILVILGALAVLVPVLATLAITIFLGWIILISGVVGLVSVIWMRRAPGFIWALISAILGVVAGAILLGWPISGMLSLTLVMIAFFFIEGIVTIMFALDHRSELPNRWAWMLTSGIIDLILGVIILAGLPGSAAWALGLLVGINMAFGGAALISMALAARAKA